MGALGVFLRASSQNLTEAKVETMQRCGRLAAVLLVAVMRLVAADDYSCKSMHNSTVVHCDSQKDCCGEGTMSAQCLQKGKQCCTHHLAATQCGADETCCGLGHAAGAYSF